MTRRTELRHDLELVSLYLKQSTSVNERLAYIKLQKILKDAVRKV